MPFVGRRLEECDHAARSSGGHGKGPFDPPPSLELETLPRPHIKIEKQHHIVLPSLP